MNAASLNVRNDLLEICGSAKAKASKARARQIKMGSCQVVRQKVVAPVRVAGLRKNTENKLAKDIGELPSGKAAGFGPAIRGFESYLPSGLKDYTFSLLNCFRYSL